MKDTTYQDPNIDRERVCLEFETCEFGVTSSCLYFSNQVSFESSMRTCSTLCDPLLQL